MIPNKYNNITCIWLITIIWWGGFKTNVNKDFHVWLIGKQITFFFMLKISMYWFAEVGIILSHASQICNPKLVVMSLLYMNTSKAWNIRSYFVCRGQLTPVTSKLPLVQSACFQCLGKALIKYFNSSQIFIIWSPHLHLAIKHVQISRVKFVTNDHESGAILVPDSIPLIFKIVYRVKYK